MVDRSFFSRNTEVSFYSKKSLLVIGPIFLLSVRVKVKKNTFRFFFLLWRAIFLHVQH